MKKMFQNVTTSGLIAIIVALAMVITSVLPYTNSEARAESNQTAPMFSDEDTNEPAASVKAPGVLPGDEELPPPFSVVSHFPTGTNIVDPINIPEQKAELAKIVDRLEKTQDVIIVFGETSLKSMTVCWYEEDFSYVRQPSKHDSSAHPKAKKATGNQTCNRILGYGRGVAIQNWLAQQNPKYKNRVIPLLYAAWGNREGTNFDNQTAVIFVLSKERVNRQEFPGIITPCPDCETEQNLEFQIPPNCGITTVRDGNTTKIMMVCVQECKTSERLETGAPPPPPPPPHKDPKKPIYKKTGFWAVLGGLVIAGVLLGIFSSAGAQGANGAGDAGLNM